MEKHRFQHLHTKQSKEESDAKGKQPKQKACRAVLGRTQSWREQFGKLSVSFENTRKSYVALLG